jgi:intracellular septation protein
LPVRQGQVKAVTGKTAFLIPVPSIAKEIPSGMKLLFDFLPILLFFIAYKMADIYVATGVLIVVTLAQTGWIWLRQRRIEKLPLFTAGLVLVLGGATLLLQDPIFVKWKPTVVNWLFALAFLASRFIGQKTLLERMVGGQLELPAPVWVKLTFAWVIFFFAMGVANLYVAFNFDENTWVNFKLFGMLGLTLVFVLAQGAYMSRYLKLDDTPPEES